jgi:hypothetical protein
MAATVAALAVASAYGSGPVLILTAAPMLVIANSSARETVTVIQTSTVSPAPLVGWLNDWLSGSGIST